MQHAIVKKYAPLRDIAQRRRTEQSAIFGIGLQIGTKRSAQAEIVVARISVRGDFQVTRHADRGKPEVGELRKCSFAYAAGMAARAIAPGWIVEGGEPAQLRWV